MSAFDVFRPALIMWLLLNWVQAFCMVMFLSGRSILRTLQEIRKELRDQ